ncbi:MAG: Crp/Fnr family transcriptional regulator [Bacillota bacterium]|nr:Crp/Fnr family transcriptional regulator [Bacillota bacterium]
MEKARRIIKTYQKGDVIFYQGERQCWMYDIHIGKVGIYANYVVGDEKLLTVLEHGDFFGEMGLVDNYPRSATAVAMENGTKVEIISLDDLEEYFAEDPERVLQIMEQMSRRIRELTESYLDACRTVAEANHMEERGEEKPQGLMDRLKKLMDDHAVAVGLGLGKKG